MISAGAVDNIGAILALDVNHTYLVDAVGIEPTTFPSRQERDGTLWTNFSIYILLFLDLISRSRLIACARVLNISEYTSFHGIPRLV